MFPDSAPKVVTDLELHSTGLHTVSSISITPAMDPPQHILCCGMQKCTWQITSSLVLPLNIISPCWSLPMGLLQTPIPLSLSQAVSHSMTASFGGRLTGLRGSWGGGGMEIQ